MNDLALRLARKRDVSRLTDRCDIDRPTGSTFNPTTGTYTETSDPVVEDTPCLASSETANVVDAAGQPVTINRVKVRVSYTVDPEVDDVVTLTESSDPSLVALPLRVRSIGRGSYVVGRLLICEEQQ